jgi:single-stranded-DNA-specific exonuclease
VDVADAKQKVKDAVDRARNDLPTDLPNEPNVQEINFSDINPKLIRLLSQFEPFGPQNMTPVFMTKGVNDSGYAKQLGKEEEHLKLFVKQNNSHGFGAIGFGLGNQLDLVANKRPIDIVYNIDENEFNGKVTVQLRLKDLR